MITHNKQQNIGKYPLITNNKPDKIVEIAPKMQYLEYAFLSILVKMSDDFVEGGIEIVSKLASEILLNEKAIADKSCATTNPKNDFKAIYNITENIFTILPNIIVFLLPILLTKTLDGNCKNIVKTAKSEVASIICELTMPFTSLKNNTFIP